MGSAAAYRWSCAPPDRGAPARLPPAGTRDRSPPLASPPPPAQHVPRAPVQLGARRGIVGKRRSSDEQRPFLRQQQRLEWWYGTTRVAERDQHSAGAEAVEAAHENRLADRIVHDVDASPAGEVLCFGDEIL